jgi:hypothetical protein
MKDKLERMWKEDIVAYFEVLSRNLPGKNEENDKNSDTIVRDSNRVAPDYRLLPDAACLETCI